MRNATLNASISRLAPNKYASTCSRTTPNNRLLIVATLTIAADRARRSPAVTGEAEVDVVWEPIGNRNPSAYHSDPHTRRAAPNTRSAPANIVRFRTLWTLRECKK